MRPILRTTAAALLIVPLTILAGCNDLTGDVTNDDNGTGSDLMDDLFVDVFENTDTADELAAELREQGFGVTTGQTIDQPFLGAAGTELLVNGASIQTFEYPTDEAAERDADQISDDGRTIGTAQVNWQDEPHFFRDGRLIVLYVGRNEVILDALEDTLGFQIAGTSRLFNGDDDDGTGAILDGTGGWLY